MKFPPTLSRYLQDKHPTSCPLKDYPGEYTYKYPKAGYPNSKVEVRTYDIKSHVTRTMKLPLDTDGYIPRIRFTKDANKLAIMTLNRHQDRFDLYFADPRSTLCKLILRDESPYYIKEKYISIISSSIRNISACLANVTVTVISIGIAWGVI